MSSVQTEFSASHSNAHGLEIGPGSQSIAIMADLKRATASLHQALEKRVNFKQALTSKSSYAELLAIFLGFFARLEPRIMETPNLSAWLPDLYTRRRVSLLVDDLRFLGIPQVSIRLCESVPEPQSVEAAFGCLYVLEGSTLGGRYISQAATESLGFRDGTGIKFFSAHGRDVMAAWMTFGSCLERFISANPQARNEIVRHALLTFESLDGWLKTSAEERQSSTSQQELRCEENTGGVRIR